MSDNSRSSRLTLNRYKISSLMYHRGYLNYFPRLLDTFSSFVDKTFIFLSTSFLRKKTNFDEAPLNGHFKIS